MSEGPQTLRSSPYTPTRGEGYSLDSDPNMDSGHKDSWHVMHRVSGPQHADAPGCARGCCEARRGRAAAETGEQRHEVTNPKQPPRRGQAARRAHASLRSESVLGSRERHVSCRSKKGCMDIFELELKLERPPCPSAFARRDCGIAPSALKSGQSRRQL
jgi:hypothetical protein